MNKEFCTYSQSIALKELGFDEPCIKYYWTDGMFVKGYEDPFNYNKRDNVISAPLYQQAFRWFRGKYDITQTIARDGSLAKEGRWAYTIIADLIYFNDGYFTYEEAESACLDKLIEICKNK